MHDARTQTYVSDKEKNTRGCMLVGGESQPDPIVWTPETRLGNSDGLHPQQG